MTLTLTYDLYLGFCEMCYYFSMRQTHWWSNFSNRSINKDFIGYAVFLPLHVKRFDLGKNGRHFRNQRAKGNLHADFERNHTSNLNLNTNTTLTLWTSPVSSHWCQPLHVATHYLVAHGEITYLKETVHLRKIYAF